MFWSFVWGDWPNGPNGPNGCSGLAAKNAGQVQLLDLFLHHRQLYAWLTLHGAGLEHRSVAARSETLDQPGGRLGRDGWASSHVSLATCFLSPIT